MKLNILKNNITPYWQNFMDIFLQLSEREEHPKDVQLLDSGKICRKIYFIEKGILRFYYFNEQGKDVTHWFQFEDNFITEIDSFIGQKESDYCIETLEDSVVRTISLDKFTQLSNIFPEAEKIWVAVLAEFLIELGEKVKDLQFRDAKTRYDNLLKKHPDILQRVALGHIASYLGVTQQSLSRIRRQK